MNAILVVLLVISSSNTPTLDGQVEAQRIEVRNPEDLPSEWRKCLALARDINKGLPAGSPSRSSASGLIASCRLEKKQ